MKKHVGIVLALTAALAVPVQAKAVSGEKTTVVFWNSLSGDSKEIMELLVDKFNEQSGDVYVELKCDSSFLSNLQASLPGGDAPDLILMNTNQISGYSGYLRSIDDIWENTGLKETDFTASCLNLCYNGDMLAAIPFQIGVVMMYYNLDLFEQAGVESVPVTFREWTEAAEAISALTTDEDPVYGSGLYYCYGGRMQALIQRFGTGYVIEGDSETGYEANLLDNQAFAEAMIWMKNLYDCGWNPLERDIRTMMKDGQIGIMADTSGLREKLESEDIRYGIAPLPTVNGDDQQDYAMADVTAFMITTSATDREARAAEQFIAWWMTGEGLEASEETDEVDYSSVTPDVEWAVSRFYPSAYLPTVNSSEYQKLEELVSLTPGEDAQIQLYTAPGNRCYSDAATCVAEYLQDWILNGPTDPDWEDVQLFFANYQSDLEEYIEEHY